ncbi:MAG: AAA family ATPase [Planctomycetes bacterium]|nr:AAA family ATPase [Planctomycetota bacterium]
MTGVRRRENSPPAADGFPFDLPLLDALPLEFESAVTFLVGENGTGKSTLIEAIADLCELPVSGGSKNEYQARHGPEDESPLSRAVRPVFRVRPGEGYFFRAEMQAHFASLLDSRRRDPEFGSLNDGKWLAADPYALYGGQSLHTMSHGEAFLAILQNRIQEGLFLLDEPESALSPQRQLVLLLQMRQWVDGGDTQFVIATHSPILMTYPGADIVSLDDGGLKRITLEETTHYAITHGILDAPERYWKHLVRSDNDSPSE